jgi:hypothetical protein
MGMHTYEMEAAIAARMETDYRHPCEYEYGLAEFETYTEAEIWLGHSLPPQLAGRGTDSRGGWRRREEEELIDLLNPPEEGGLAGFHRKMKEAAEFVQVFGELDPRDFKQQLKQYLEEPTLTETMELN